MAYLSRKTRFAGLKLGLVLAILFACVEGDMRTCFASSASVSQHQDQGWVVSVPTPLVSNSTVTGTVEGGPPPAGGAPPPFAISIELNGWQHGTGVATFNQETGKWEFDIILPPGSAGSDMRIVLIPDVGEPVTTIVKIT